MALGEWKIRVLARIKDRNGIWHAGCQGIGGSESQAMTDLRQQNSFLGIQEIEVTNVQRNENGRWVD